MEMRSFKNQIDGMTYAFEVDTQQHLIDECLSDPETWLEVDNQNPQPTLAESKITAIKRINQAHAEFLLKAVGNPTQAEINTWSLKLSIKDAVLANAELNPEQAAFFDGLGLNTTAEQQAFAEEVQRNASYSSFANGKADAVRKQAKQAIADAQTVEALDAVLFELKALAETTLAEVLALKG